MMDIWICCFKFRHETELEILHRGSESGQCGPGRDWQHCTNP